MFYFYLQEINSLLSNGTKLCSFVHYLENVYVRNCVECPDRQNVLPAPKTFSFGGRGSQRPLQVTVRLRITCYKRGASQILEGAQERKITLVLRVFQKCISMNKEVKDSGDLTF